MVLQHSSVRKSLLCHICYDFVMILFNAKVGTFPLGYTVLPSFISCFTTFYCIDPYFNFETTNFKIPVSLVFVSYYIVASCSK